MGFFFAMNSPIGIFDSGYGGLTVLKSIKKLLPQYDYLYLGDNARAPYGSRSFDVVYQYTREAIQYLFKQNCHLIILACNTASRSIHEFVCTSTINISGRRRRSTSLNRNNLKDLICLQ